MRDQSTRNTPLLCKNNTILKYYIIPCFIYISRLVWFECKCMASNQGCQVHLMDLTAMGDTKRIYVSTSLQAFENEGHVFLFYKFQLHDTRTKFFQPHNCENIIISQYENKVIGNSIRKMCCHVLLHFCLLDFNQCVIYSDAIYLDDLEE